jgi:hypothetical protein
MLRAEAVGQASDPALPSGPCRVWASQTGAAEEAAPLATYRQLGNKAHRPEPPCFHPGTIAPHSRERWAVMLAVAGVRPAQGGASIERPAAAAAAAAGVCSRGRGDRKGGGLQLYTACCTPVSKLGRQIAYRRYHATAVHHVHVRRRTCTCFCRRCSDAWYCTRSKCAFCFLPSPTCIRVDQIQVGGRPR